MKKSYISKFNKFGRCTLICSIIFLYILFYYEAFAMMLDIIYTFKNFIESSGLGLYLCLCFLLYFAEGRYIYYINHSVIEKKWNKTIARLFDCAYCLTIVLAVLFVIFCNIENSFLLKGDSSIIMFYLELTIYYTMCYSLWIIFRSVVWLVSLF